MNQQEELRKFVEYSAGYFLAAFHFFKANNLEEEQAERFAATITGLMFSAAATRTANAESQLNMADLLAMAHPKGQA